MKGATLLATLQALGVATSFSRPSVSNDNPFSESFFRTMKYRPAFPDGPFESIEAACAWMTAFVRWYNTEHRHSGIRFVTPEERHSGREAALLEQRKVVYAKARAARPERWARSTQELAADRRGHPQSRTGRPGSSRRVRSPPQAATTLTLIAAADGERLTFRVRRWLLDLGEGELTGVGLLLLDREEHHVRVLLVKAAQTCGSAAERRSSKAALDDHDRRPLQRRKRPRPPIDVA